MPSHPLRRISTGSLSSLARSTDRNHAPSDLDFLEPALVELVDEAATLASNVQRLNNLHAALGTFNEGFAAYLYAIKMNAFSMSWPEAPMTETWDRLPELTAALAASTAASERAAEVTGGNVSWRASPSSPRADHAGDMTYATVYSDGETPVPAPKRKAAAGTRAGAGSGTAGTKRPATGTAGGTAAARRAAMAAKKRREVEIANVIDTQLPLAYRGDPEARSCMEGVIDRLWDGDGLPIGDIVKQPDMPLPRVNKALIALVAKKLVAKSSAKGKTIYTWTGGQ